MKVINSDRFIECITRNDLLGSFFVFHAWVQVPWNWQLKINCFVNRLYNSASTGRIYTPDIQAQTSLDLTNKYLTPEHLFTSWSERMKWNSQTRNWQPLELRLSIWKHLKKKHVHVLLIFDWASKQHLVDPWQCFWQLNNLYRCYNKQFTVWFTPNNK